MAEGRGESSFLPSRPDTRGPNLYPSPPPSPSLSLSLCRTPLLLPFSLHRPQTPFPPPPPPPFPLGESGTEGGGGERPAMCVVTSLYPALRLRFSYSLSLSLSLSPLHFPQPTSSALVNPLLLEELLTGRCAPASS